MSRPSNREDLIRQLLNHFAGIVETYHAFEDVERFASVADLAEALAQMREAERRRDEATARMDALLAELGNQR